MQFQGDLEASPVEADRTAQAEHPRKRPFIMSDMRLSIPTGVGRRTGKRIAVGYGSGPVVINRTKLPPQITPILKPGGHSFRVAAVSAVHPDVGDVDQFLAGRDISIWPPSASNSSVQSHGMASKRLRRGPAKRLLPPEARSAFREFPGKKSRELVTTRSGCDTISPDNASRAALSIACLVRRIPLRGSVAGFSRIVRSRPLTTWRWQS